MVDLIKSTNTSYINATASASPSTQQEGNLRGRRVINSKERINDFKQIYHYSTFEQIRDKIVIGISAFIAAEGFADFIYRAGLEIVSGPSNQPLRNDVGLVCLVWGTMMTYSFTKQYNDRKNIENGINDQEFIDWAEENKIYLEDQEIAKIYSEYLVGPTSRAV